MKLRDLAIVIPALLFSGPLVAQQISPHEFLDRLTGQTAWFSSVNGLVGIEHFYGDGTTKWLRSDGSCTQGQITIEQQQICFTYEDSPTRTYCWLPRLDGDVLSVHSADVQGAVQTVTRVSRTQLHCAVDGAGV